MALQIGIVGLPNVGKSTLFQALTRQQVAAENYPFCTIDPNVGVVAVPDERLVALAPLVKTVTIIPTTMEFVDIAGLVAGAHKGEGLGNQFLSHIRDVDAIAEVVRVFHDDDVLHVAGTVDPQRDMETIQLELVMADLGVVEKLLANAQKRARGNDKEALVDVAVLEKLRGALGDAQLANRVAFASEDETRRASSMQLLTMKPFLFVANVDEHVTAGDVPASLRERNPVIVSAKVEAELAQLSEDDSREMLRELGMQESGLQQLVRRGYEVLDLLTYFTAGEKEVRAWTVPRGTHAPQAAGVIHSDFERGFIRAEVASYRDFIAYHGWVGARAAGKVRMEGKEYVVHDGDIMVFHHN